MLVDFGQNAGGRLARAAEIHRQTVSRLRLRHELGVSVDERTDEDEDVGLHSDEQWIAFREQMGEAGSMELQYE